MASRRRRLGSFLIRTIVQVLRVLDEVPAPYGHEAAAAEHLASWCSARWPRIAWTVRRYSATGASLHAAVPGTPDSAPLIYSHLDTSLSGDPAEDRPITGRGDAPGPLTVTGDRAEGFGLGVARAPAAAALTGFVTAALTEGSPPVQLLLAGSGTHRSMLTGASPAARTTGIQHFLASGARPSAAIVAKGGPPTLLWEEPGALYLRVRVTGGYGAVLARESATPPGGVIAQAAPLIEAIDRWCHHYAASGIPPTPDSPTPAAPGRDSPSARPTESARRGAPVASDRPAESTASGRPTPGAPAEPTAPGSPAPGRGGPSARPAESARRVASGAPVASDRPAESTASGRPTPGAPAEPTAPGSPAPGRGGPSARPAESARRVASGAPVASDRPAESTASGRPNTPKDSQLSPTAHNAPQPSQVGRAAGIGSLVAGRPDKPDLFAGLLEAGIYVVTVPGVVPSVLADSLKADLRAALAGGPLSTCAVEVDHDEIHPAAATSSGAPIVRAARAAWREAFGADPPPITGWTGSTDGVVLRAHGIDTVRLGPRAAPSPADLRRDVARLPDLATYAHLYARLALTCGELLP
ncbi:hypothetical protein ACFY4C_23575 [Actinomadura viridis]|uniref:hypothetical protein n=1 Tax=Actinomadura viridis TaxID=58110 RepID=UPI00368D72D7